MPAAGPERIGDYLLFSPFATGGAATVHLGRLVRGGGFQRLVVVKRLHPHVIVEAFAEERLLREARVSSRIRSPYVVPILDVIRAKGELCLVIEFVQGVTLGRLLQLAGEERRAIPPAVAVAIIGQALRGLHAAHDATGEDGSPLELVHRDVSPNNVIVGADGLARILDFGIAKALGEQVLTASNEIQGTLGYMAPEQFRRGLPVTRQADIHAVGVLLWEALTGVRLRPSADVQELLASFAKEPPPPSARRPRLPEGLDAVVLRALSRDPADRFPTAQAMIAELEYAVAPAPTDVVVKTLELLAFDELDRLRELVARCERGDRSAAPQAPAVALPASGSLVAGKYRIGNVLGSGAMGIVFAATNELLGTPVAVKVVQADHLGDAKAMARMLREARATQKVEGPHLVRVLDVGMAENFAYLVMERLQGTDLRALLAGRGPLPIDVAVLYALHACDALAEAHALGIVHRDLKPANLFLTSTTDGRPLVKVLDFGIAKETLGDEDDASRSLTATSAVLGSPAYMAPEQIRSPKSVDARADVWALAVVLYELLTAALPFLGDTSASLLASVSADGWIPIRTVRPDVPRPLSVALERCLAKNPSERTPSMLALAAEILPFAPPDYAPRERLRQASAPLRSTQRRRRIALIVGAAGGALALVALAGVGLAARGRSSGTAAGPAPTLPADPPPAIAEPAITDVASVAVPLPPAPPTSAVVTTPRETPSTSPPASGHRAHPRGRAPSPARSHETAEPTATAAPTALPAPKLDPTSDFR